MLSLLPKLASTATTLILVISWMTHGIEGLRCYKCLALDCPEKEKFFRDQVRNFVMEQLPDIYYNYEYDVPECPSPDNEDRQWEGVKESSRAACGEDNSGEATCVLGRFRIVTYVIDLNRNVTSHGTATGCAKRKLLSYIRSATLKQKCSMVRATSKVKLSLQHFLEIEHCSALSEMCSDDWCVAPVRTVIKPFLNSLKEEDRGSSGFLRIVLYLGIGLGFLIGIISLLGMKFEGSGRSTYVADE